MAENILNISNLPRHAQKQLIDFWEFLSLKYSSDKDFFKKDDLKETNHEKLDRLHFLASKIKTPSIDNPIEWQKNERKDRKLQGRNS